MTSMRVSVLVPSYRRSSDLVRCLAALAAQRRPADQVLVIARQGDTETISAAAAWRERVVLDIIEVEAGGQVHALNAGLAHCKGDIVAITDDDAAPRSDWLEKIAAYFENDPKLGGVGGRDWVHERGIVLDGQARRVGRFEWFGRMVGNHHLGAGPVREVDFLKGANCSFRLAAIAPTGFDERLLGAGAQVHNDMAASLAVKQAGWKLIYDPLVAVDHFPASRFDEAERNQFDAQATANQIRNFRFAIASGLPPRRRAAVLLWSRLIGTRADPGLIRVFNMLIKKDHVGLSRHRSVQLLLMKKH